MKTKNKIVSLMGILILAITIGISLASLNSTAKANQAETAPNMVNYFSGYCVPIPYDCGPVVIITPDY